MYSDLTLQTQAAIKIYCHSHSKYTPSGCSTFMVNGHQDATNYGKDYKTFMLLVVKASNPVRLSKKITNHLNVNIIYKRTMNQLVKQFQNLHSEADQ